MVRVLRPAPEPPKASPVIANFPQAPELDSTNVELNFLAIFDYAKKLRDWAQLGLIEQREQAADIATNVTDIAGKAATVHVHAASDVTSLTFADARIAESNVTQHEAAVDHDALANFAVGEHRIINDAGTSATELYSASKISTDLAGKAASSHTHAATDIDITGATEELAIVDGDEVLIYDASATANRKTPRQNLFSGFSSDVSASLSAEAGGGQTGAGVATTFNRVATVASAGDSITLQTAKTGLFHVYENATATSMDLFPNTSDEINSEGTNNAFTVAGGKFVLLFAQSAANWRAVLLN